MTTENEEKDTLQTSSAVPPRHRLQQLPSSGEKSLKVRNILNLVFMLGALLGVILYFALSSPTVGIIVILTAMVFKIIECVIRFIN
jgi:VIT1/CCC1 family predicted Fe2+/Mn2+ transporter